MSAGFGTTDRSTVVLQTLELAVGDGKYRDVLAALAPAIRAAGDRAEEASTHPDPHYADVVIDDECDLVENLLGAAFVVCQTQITAITSRALAFRDAMVEDGRASPAFSDEAAVRKLGAPVAPAMLILGAGPVGSVELVWALANYFKHRDEWRGADWGKLEKKQQTATARVIASVGLTAGSTGNLRTAAEALGNAGYGDLAKFADAVDAWGEEVLRRCETALRAAGV